MEIHQIEHRTKLKRDKSNQAISLATQGKWDEAATVNQELLDVIPDDVEALNRMGKALSETGRYADARKALESALEISPSNAIARKNLDRMAGLKDEPTSSKPNNGAMGRLTPQVFIEESGKSTTTSLLGLADASVFAQVTSADVVGLVVDGATVEVQNRDGQSLGRLEPKLAARLIKLLDGGNKYVAAVASISAKGVAMVVRETYQSSKMSGLVSFPAPKGRASAYIADIDMDVDLDDGADFDTSASWTPPAGVSDGAEGSSEEQAPVKVKRQRPTWALADEEVEDEEDEEVEV
jgi:hypothetical protein